MIRPDSTTAAAIAGALSLSLASLALTTGCAGSDAATADHPTWHSTDVHAVSRTGVAGGIAATTSLRPDGTLETVALDLASGRRLWAAPAAMAGRLPGMGVAPPAVVETAQDQSTVVATAPAESPKGRWNATLVAYDGRTGQRRWTRPVHSTFGPQRCGRHLCLSEHTALAGARVVVLDATTGRVAWKLPGIAEVEWSDDTRVVLLRLAAHPVLEAYELATGKRIWQLPVEDALGPGVTMSGGWAFGSTDRDLIGYVAPYTDPKTRKVGAFGLFSVALADGTVNWMRPSVVRVYPSGNPGLAPIVRPVDEQGQYGGFARIDPTNGRVLGQIPAAQVPGSGWWLAFPPQLDRLGFLKHGGAGTVYDLATGAAVEVAEQRGWSFCTPDPKPLQLKDQAQTFYSVASLCEFDLGTGKRVESAGAPPAWFTGSHGGWRLWRDEKGGLHGVKDDTATGPGMYG